MNIIISYFALNFESCDSSVVTQPPIQTWYMAASWVRILPQDTWYEIYTGVVSVLKILQRCPNLKSNNFCVKILKPE